MVYIGASMKEARLNAGLSREQLAEASGIPATSIRTYERSEAYPGILNLIYLSDALGISIDTYIGHRGGTP